MTSPTPPRINSAGNQRHAETNDETLRDLLMVWSGLSDRTRRALRDLALSSAARCKKNAPASKTGDDSSQPPANSNTYNPSPRSLSHTLPNDLVEVIWAWTNLPDALKAGVLAIVRSAKR